MAAFLEACKNGTHPSYRARINIIGHSGAGKTSLTRRLLGQKFQEKEESTDGIETHRIEFDLIEEDLKQEECWQEIELKTEELVKTFHKDVLERAGSLQAGDVLVETDDVRTDIIEEIRKFGKHEAQEELEEMQELTDREMPSEEEPWGTEVQNEHKQKEHEMQTIVIYSEVKLGKGKEKQNEKYKKKKGNPLKRLKLLVWPRKQSSQGKDSNAEIEHDEPAFSEPNAVFQQDSEDASTAQEEDKDRDEEEGEEEQPDESQKGVLRLWDFGGQTEFYTTHHMFLDADAINIIVMDISKQLKRKLSNQAAKQQQLVGIPETPEDFLCYWLRSIEMNSRERKIQPTVLLVLTHKDKVAAAEQESYIKTFIQDVKQIIQHKKLPSVSDDHIFAVNNKSGPATEFEKLRRCVKQIIEQEASWGAERPIRWLKLEADMKQRSDKKVQKPMKHLTHHEVMELANIYHMDQEELASCLLFLHSVGDLIWFPDEGLRDVIILDPQWLVDVFKVLITSEQFIKDRDLLDDVYQLLKTGLVSYSSLEKFWAGNDVRFLLEIMKKFDLLLPFESKPAGLFLVPSMLPPKQIAPQEAGILRSLHPIYTTEYRAEFEELFPIGTFAKLLAACSRKWPVLEDEDLSQNFASLSTSEKTKLVLYQPHRSSIQTSVWCQPDKLDRHPLSDILGVTTALAPIFKSHDIPSSRLCQLVCPNWRPHYALFCVTDALQESLDPESETYKNIEYIQKECLCPNITMHSTNQTQPSNSTPVQSDESKRKSPHTTMEEFNNAAPNVQEEQAVRNSYCCLHVAIQI